MKFTVSVLPFCPDEKMELKFNGEFSSETSEITLAPIMEEGSPAWFAKIENFSEWFVPQFQSVLRYVKRDLNHRVAYPKNYPIYEDIKLMATLEEDYDYEDREYYFYSAVQVDNRPEVISFDEVVEGEMVDGGETTQVIRIKLPQSAIHNGRPIEDPRNFYKIAPCGCGFDMCGHYYTRSCGLVHDIDSDEWIITHKIAQCC